MGFGSDCGIVLRHALAHGDELWRMGVVNKMSGPQVAQAMGLPKLQVMGVLRLLRNVGYVPSPERMAVCAMNDFGWDDADVAEAFSRPVEWATEVRARKAELRELEPIPLELEYVDEGLQPDDPCPEELYRRAAALRANRGKGWTMSTIGREKVAQTQGGMRHFAWNGRHASFISVIAEKWTGSRAQVG
jgi:hypothetical protein